MKVPPLKQRFKIMPFQNRAGSRSWRVYGVRRDGTVIRENYANLEHARLRQIALEVGFHSPDTLQGPGLRATRLSDDAIRICETAVARLDHADDLLAAVDHWLRHGRHQTPIASPSLDDAFDQFKAWMQTEALRELTKHNLRIRCGMFVNSTRNKKVAEITPGDIDAFLATRQVSSTTLTNDRRAISSFFSWCAERGWTAANPCLRKRRRGKRADANGHAPQVLTVDECKALLRAAENHQGGKLVPYVAVALFAGLRPFEIRRLTWEAVNLKDQEIRLEGAMTKTGHPRVVEIHPTLGAWLTASSGKLFFPANWTRHFDEVKKAAGFRGRVNDENKALKPWPVDCMRHTAISHFFRATGSYGLTAEQFGNSEGVIKSCYQGRVSTGDTKKFYEILPTKKAN